MLAQRSSGDWDGLNVGDVLGVVRMTSGEDCCRLQQRFVKTGGDEVEKHDDDDFDRRECGYICCDERFEWHCCPAALMARLCLVKVDNMISHFSHNSPSVIM
jgi:hypothetical protein